MKRPIILPALLVAAMLPSIAHAQDEAVLEGWAEAPGVAPVGKSDRLYGKADADFSLIVWLDLECPYCKMLGQQPEHVVDGGHGRVNLAVRLYPLPFHGANAVRAAQTALCVAEQAGSAGFYRFVDAWLARTRGNGRGIPDDPAGAIAAAAGARNAKALTGCTSAKRTIDRLKADMELGDAAGIEGTPAIALRDNRHGRTIMVGGALSDDDMRAALGALSRQDDAEARAAPGATR